MTGNGFGSISSNTICSGTEGDSYKLVYFTPTFFGFKLGASYSPDITGFGRDGGGTVGHNGLEEVENGDSVQATSVALSYTYATEDWGVDWSGGASWTGAVGGSVRVRDSLSDGSLSDYSVNANVSGPSYYQTGLVVSFGGLKVGGAFEFIDVNVKNDYNWVAGGGISYTVDAWTIGFQGSHGQYNTIDQGGDSDLPRGDENRNRPRITTGLDREVQRYALTGIYNFGPGIDIEGQLAYTDTSINDRTGIGLAAHQPGGPGGDYDSFEIGIGTAISF